MSVVGNYGSRLEYIKQRQEELLLDLIEDIEYLEKETNVNLGFSIEDISGILKNKSVYSVSNYAKLREKLCDKDFLNKVKPLLELIPDSNGSRFFGKFDINIGIIADEFLYNSFKDVANFYYVNRTNYIKLKIEVLIIATTWKGLDNDWKGLGNPNNTKLRSELYNIINYFRKQGVKIVFYSKEDPPNYERFLDIAKNCDYIFTTALEKVEDYKKDCKNDNVFVLEFGVNPIYNNPIGMNIKNINGAIFAGSWYEKYPHRKKDTQMIFDGVIEAEKDLKIIDRNYDLNNPDYFYPIRYLKFVSPSIKHNILQKIFKLYKWAINLNSVKTSETMFANRVYELQAMGNLILSNYSLGMNNLFPNIFIINNQNEINYIMNNVDEKELYSHQLAGIRRVLSRETTYHRINYLLNKIGYNKNFIKNRKVAVVADKNNENVQMCFSRQSYPYKELIDNNEILDVYHEFDYITFFHPDYDYGEYYLEDMVNGFKYTNSSFITKDAYYKNGEKHEGIEHNYIDQVKDKYRTIFDTKDFKINDLLKMETPINIKNGYSIDSQEIDIGHRNVEKNNLDLKLSVIIPVFNNGEQLYNKCFMSLRRSSIFENMDIVIVDDGSTDPNTIRIIDRLERLYPNVQSYKFNDGGSGSASRPRNKGVELAKTEYITYLDPDNEAVNDGYYYLLNELINNKDLDLVVGNIIKVDNESKVLNYSYNVYKYNSSGIIDNTYQFLKETNLKTQSIQALIVKKEIILKNNLKMVEGAIGQDTLFFQQLILHCSKIKALNLVIHIYYAAVSDSVTNSITKKFFERYLILEKERYKFLKSNGLLKDYINNRLNYYFVGWYLKRVPRIKEEEVSDALNILFEIYKIYKPYIKNKIEPFERFEHAMNTNEYHEFIDYCKKLMNCE